ncbi:MAG: ABC transporter substrate-binding protein [bacterium]|nr:ABC transporter substrate-binding protein [bacterium]
MKPLGMFTRNSLIRISISYLLLVVLFGCSFNPSNRVTIRFWNGFTGPDGRTMLRLVKRFNESNPTIHVLMQRMDWGTYYNKLFVAGISNRAPEVFVIHAGNIERFMHARFLRSIDDLITQPSPNGIDIADFSENIWQITENNGQHYALPLDVHILGMYYNRTLFKQAGLVDALGNPRPPKTKQEFIDALVRLTKDTNHDGQPETWGYVYTWLRTNVYTIMQQWNGKFFNSDYSQCLLNSPENVEALQFCVDLIQKLKVAPAPQNFDSWIGFRQGKVGIAFEGIYMLEDLKKQTDLEYAGAPLPLLGIKPAAWADSHLLCLKSGLDGKKLDASWRFIKFLSDNSLDWADGGQIPVRKSLRATDRFHRMEVQYEFATQIPYICYVPRIPYIFEFLTEFDIAVEKALRGSLSPKLALDIATENVNQIIRRQRQVGAIPSPQNDPN